MTMQLKGIAASGGISIAKAYILTSPNLEVTERKVASPADEISKLDQAIKAAESDLQKLKEKITNDQGAEAGLIFEAHLTILADPEYMSAVKEKINGDSVCAEYGLSQVSDMYITMFESMDDAYMRERAADIKDISRRVTAYILGVPLVDLSLIDEKVILIAEDLTPSDTAQLNKEFVQGFVTNIGGRTSHSAIMARSMEIPAVVGTKTATESVQKGDLIIVDGFAGETFVNPSVDLVGTYKKKQEEHLKQKLEWSKFIDKKSVTADNHHVEIMANIGSPSSLAGVLENGAEGVGLYRTEFLYMESEESPTEDEQFEAYKKVLEGVNNQPVVVRTLDIGGDKELPYLKMAPEMNPFLGYRAIRICLNSEKELFRTQLRALLRASIYGDLKIMFPMIATVEEFRTAKAMLLEEKAKLVAAGVSVSDSIEIGMMVEIPASAIIADQFAKEVDFFSIGTNDLIQYTMAADRMNEGVSYLYQPFNPAILRLVKMVIDASHAEGKWTGMCGEMAGEELAAPLLIGLGLDEFSMSASSVLRTRSIISKLKKSDMEVLATEALQKSTEIEVVELVQKTLAKASV